jgi:hypothetical protein
MKVRLLASFNHKPIPNFDDILSPINRPIQRTAAEVCISIPAGLAGFFLKPIQNGVARHAKNRRISQRLLEL